MSRESDAIIADCKERMEKLSKALNKPDCDVGVNRALWWSAYNRMNAVLNARHESRNMHWTTSGDFSHLQSSPPVRF